MKREVGLYLLDASEKIEKGETVKCPECGENLAMEKHGNSYIVQCTNKECSVKITARGI